MSQATISGSIRETFGSKASKAARAEGKVPVTISRPGQDSQHILISAKDADELAASKVGKTSIEVDGTAVDVVLKDVSKNVLTDQIQHIDLIAVTDDSEVVLAIPVHPLAKNCPGIKAGGLLEQSLRKVTIRCKVANLPEYLEVDLSDTQVDQTVYVRNCTLPEGAKFITKPNVAMISILRTRGMKKAEQEASDEAASEG